MNDPVILFGIVLAAYLTVVSAAVVVAFARTRPVAPEPTAAKVTPAKAATKEAAQAAEATAATEQDRKRVVGFLGLVWRYGLGLAIAVVVGAVAQLVLAPFPSVMPEDRRRIVLALILGWSLVCLNTFVAWHLVGALLPPDSAKPAPGTMGGRIGILERALVVMLVLSGGPASIGFVVAAKTIARFKELEDRGFAERYLLGTLASVTIALASALAAQQIWINAA